MKIAEVKQLIETNGLSEELFEEFKLSLRRVPALKRCEHCYITAYHLRISDADEERRKKNYEDAFRLIEYGIEIHPRQVPENQRAANYYLRAAYEHMGMAYGDIGNYALAKLNLQKASVIEEYSPIMEAHFAHLIARMELHISHFTYTPYLEELYEKMLMADEFSANLRKNLFYRSLVEIIIANKNKDKKAKRIACNHALSALGIGIISDTDRILKKHKALFALMVNPSDEALVFLKKNL